MLIYQAIEHSESYNINKPEINHEWYSIKDMDDLFSILAEDEQYGAWVVDPEKGGGVVKYIKNPSDPYVKA